MSLQGVQQSCSHFSDYLDYLCGHFSAALFLYKSKLFLMLFLGAVRPSYSHWKFATNDASDAVNDADAMNVAAD